MLVSNLAEQTDSANAKWQMQRGGWEHAQAGLQCSRCVAAPGPVIHSQAQWTGLASPNKTNKRTTLFWMLRCRCTVSSTLAQYEAKRDSRARVPSSSCTSSFGPASAPAPPPSPSAALDRRWLRFFPFEIPAGLKRKTPWMLYFAQCEHHALIQHHALLQHGSAHMPPHTTH